jgi:ArsR family transcriptional regulator
LAAGDIAEELRVAPNTLSPHLAVLARAGLVSSRRQGRSVIYAIDLEGTQELLAFLVEDCCRAERKVCRPLIASALSRCC